MWAEVRLATAPASAKTASYGPAKSCEDDVVTGSDSSVNGDRGDEGKGIAVESREAPPKEEED